MKTVILLAASTYRSSNVKGGHYRSAVTIANMLSHDYEVILFNVGSRPSPVMSDAVLDFFFVKGSSELPSASRNETLALCVEKKVFSVVAFDQKAAQFFRPLAVRLKIGMVHVKPGGGQPRLYFPRFKNAVVFTRSDQRWLMARSKNSALVEMAPGRVKTPPQDEALTQKLTQQLDIRDDQIIILRIGRIDPHYAAVSKAALALAALLRSHGLPARCVLIGVVQDQSCFEELLENLSPDDALVTDDIYTLDASRLLSGFRYNVGTGRGFMEGAAIGQVMLCATNDPAHSTPVLVDENNFELFMSHNFSPRARPEITPQENIQRLLDYFRSPPSPLAVQEQSKAWFNEHFSVDTAKHQYHNVISSSIKNPEIWNCDVLLGEVHLRFSVIIDLLRQALAR